MGSTLMCNNTQSFCCAHRRCQDFCLLVKMETCGFFFFAAEDKKWEFALFPMEVWMSASEFLTPHFNSI